MKATFVSKEKNDVTFTMEFTAGEFEDAIIKAYRKSKDKFRINGFRKGKAPRKLIEQHYGESVFYEDAINGLFSEAYPNAVDDLSLEVVDQPRAEFGEIQQGKDFTVTITVAVFPEVNIKDYKGVEIEKVDDTVSEEDITKELEALQKKNARLIMVERPIQEGDTAIIDYEGWADDIQFEGGTAERQALKIGSGSFIPGFEEQLIGAKVGDDVDVKVTFPEEYHAENLAGKEALFKCKVHEIKEEELPELNDDFAMDVSEFDTVEALKEDIKERLEKNAKETAQTRMRNAILEKIYHANEIDIPDAMVEDEIDMMMREFDQQLQSQGMNLQQYLQYLGKDPKDMRQEMREQAQKTVKTKILVSAVAEAEKIQVVQEDVDRHIETMAEQYKMDVEKIKEALQGENRAYLEKDLRNQKAVDFLYENAVIK